MSEHLDRVALRRLWEVAIAEDGADRDITSEVAIEPTAQGIARVMAKAAGVMAGNPVFDLLREA